MRGTIKSKEDVERLFQRGRRSSSSLMTMLLIEKSGQQPGRCAFIAGKKLGNAPFRSRCKRVMRQVVRELGGPWDEYDIALIARQGIAYADHEHVIASARRQLEKLGVL